MTSHKFGRHQLLVMKLIVESYANHFCLNGNVKQDEKKNFIYDLERSLKALRIHRGVKNLRKVIGNRYFRAELGRILKRKSIGFQTTFVFQNQTISNDDSHDFIIIPEKDNGDVLDQTLSGSSTISNSDVFLPIEKPLPYKPGELQETIVDENEEDEVSFNPNMQHVFCCPNFDYKYEVEPHPSPLDRVKVPNDDFVTKRKKERCCFSLIQVI